MADLPVWYGSFSSFLAVRNGVLGSLPCGVFGPRAPAVLLVCFPTAACRRCGKFSWPRAASILLCLIAQLLLFYISRCCWPDFVGPTSLMSSRWGELAVAGATGAEKLICRDSNSCVTNVQKRSGGSGNDSSKRLSFPVEASQISLEDVDTPWSLLWYLYTCSECLQTQLER